MKTLAKLTKMASSRPDEKNIFFLWFLKHFFLLYRFGARCIDVEKMT